MIFYLPFFLLDFIIKHLCGQQLFGKNMSSLFGMQLVLGKSPKTDDPHQYEHYHYHCDIANSWKWY